MTTTVSTSAAASASANGSAAITANGKATAPADDFMALVEALNGEQADATATAQANVATPGVAAPVATGAVKATAGTAAANPPPAQPAAAQTLVNGDATAAAPQAALAAPAAAPEAQLVAAPLAVAPIEAVPPAIQIAVSQTVLVPVIAPLPAGKTPAPALPSVATTATATVAPATTTIPTPVTTAADAAASAIAAPIPVAPLAEAAPVALTSTSTDIAATAAVDETSAAETPATDTSATTLLTVSVTKGWSASSNLQVSLAGSGQKLPAAGMADTVSTAADPRKSPLDSNALTQAAALTVTSTPLVVPAAAPLVADTAAAAVQPLGAQFSLFTKLPAKAAPATDASDGETVSDDDDADAETGAATATAADSIDADAAPIVLPAAPADSFGQSKFSGEVTQVLSMAQAGIARPDKDSKSAAGSDSGSATISNDNVLASGGLTLTRQESGQGFITTAPAATADSPLVYQPPVDQVSVIMQRAAAAGETSAMTIALNPADLGRVEISLKFGKNGSVQANVMADKAGTLDLLKNDQSSLHQALENAGLSPDSASLSFNLRDDQAQQGQSQNFDGQNSQSTGNQNDAESDNQLVSSAIHYAVQATGDGHVNLFA